MSFPGARCAVFRPFADQPEDDLQPGRGDQAVDQDEKDERQEDVPGRDDDGGSVGRSQNPIDGPGLSPDLGGDPSELVGQKRKRRGEQEDLQEPAGVPDLPPRQEEDTGQAEPNEGHPEDDHQVVGNERQDDRRLLVVRELIEPRDLGLDVAMDQEAQEPGDTDGEMRLPGPRIGNPE